jgi:hypothetical protein
MIHSKFVAPLPPNMNEFMCSLRMVFSNVVDISHMWREIGPLRKAKNIQAALSYIQRQFFVPMEIEIPHQGIVLAIITDTKCFLVIHISPCPCVFKKLNVECIIDYMFIVLLHQLFFELNTAREAPAVVIY